MDFIQSVNDVDYTEIIQNLIELYFKHDYESICQILNINENISNDNIPIDKYNNKGMIFSNNENPTVKVRISIDQEIRYIFKTISMITSNIMYERSLTDLIINKWIKNYGKFKFNNSDIISVGDYTRSSIEVGQKTWKELITFGEISNLNIRYAFKLAVLSFIDDDIMIPLIHKNELKLDTQPIKYETKKIEVLKNDNYVISDDVDKNELMLFIENKIEKLNDCWIWKKNMNGNYGRLVFNNNVGLAHRISYILKYGYIQKEMFICHKCDNPSCVNPEHLFVGTTEDNLKDAVNKGRYATNVLFDKKQIEKIHAMFDEGLNKTEIANKLGFSTKQIDAAFNRYLCAQKFKNY